MENLQELRDQQSAVLAEAEVLLNDNKVVTEDDRKVIEEKFKMSDGLRAKIAELESVENYKTKLAADKQELETKNRRKVVPVIPSHELQTIVSTDRAIPANYLRSKPRHIKGADAQEKAFRFGMWCLGAMGNARAKEYCTSHGIEYRVNNETTNTAGGYLVPAELSSTIIDLREEYGVFRQLAKVWPMSSDQLTIPRRSGGLTAYFVNEGGSITSSDKTWDAVTLVTKKLAAITTYTSELAMDAVINIGDDLASEISYAFSSTEDNAGFNGDGTSTYGGIEGVRSKLTAATAGIVTANSGTHTDWSQITMPEMSAVIGKLPAFAQTPKAGWIVSQGFYGQVMIALAATAGGGTPEQIAALNLNRQFLGYPVYVSQRMPLAQGTAEIVALFGDLSLAAAFGDRMGVSVQFSLDATVDSINMFQQDRIAIRGTERFDIVVHDVGNTSVSGPIVGLLTAA